MFFFSQCGVLTVSAGFFFFSQTTFFFFCDVYHPEKFRKSRRNSRETNNEKKNNGPPFRKTKNLSAATHAIVEVFRVVLEPKRSKHSGTAPAAAVNEVIVRSRCQTPSVVFER